MNLLSISLKEHTERMNESPRSPDCHALSELIAEAQQLLAKCDEYGLSLIAIDVSSAIDKLEERLREQAKG